MASLLSQIDYELISKNPRILCGFSDITTLGIAITARTGLVTFSGPHFSTMAMQGPGGEVMAEWVRECLFGEGEMEWTASLWYRDDRWYLEGIQPEYLDNSGHWLIREPHGIVTGMSFGGSLAYVQLLPGTKYWPTELLHNQQIILLVEWCAESAQGLNASFLNASLHRLLLALHQTDTRVEGVVLGRMERASEITREQVEAIFGGLIECGLLATTVPVIANCDFGHTYPLRPFPIGGQARIDQYGSISLKW